MHNAYAYSLAKGSRDRSRLGSRVTQRFGGLELPGVVVGVPEIPRLAHRGLGRPRSDRARGAPTRGPRSASAKQPKRDALVAGGHRPVDAERGRASAPQAPRGRLQRPRCSRAVERSPLAERSERVAEVVLDRWPKAAARALRRLLLERRRVGRRQPRAAGRSTALAFAEGRQRVAEVVCVAAQSSGTRSRVRPAARHGGGNGLLQAASTAPVRRASQRAAEVVLA